MKKLAVVLFLICATFGAWQPSGEIILPKGIQVDDLTIDNTGELWMLSASSILKLEAAKRPLLIEKVPDAKLLTVLDDIGYLVDQNNRLVIAELGAGIVQPTNIFFNVPSQLSTAMVDNEATLVVLEPSQLTFATSENVLGMLHTAADRFCIIPLADYSSTQTPFYTLTNNQIRSWTGGTFTSPQGYTNEVLFSTSNNVLDFSVDHRGNLYILMSDSVIVLESDGTYRSKIPIDNASPESKLLVNSVNNTIILYNHLTQSLTMLSEVGQSERGETIILNKNRPNPVDNYTEIEFTIRQPLDLTITIYNLIGEPVRVVAKGYYSKGVHRVIWNANDEQGNFVPNGVYFYRLESKSGVAIRQLIVLR
jgi:hypothetical protein